MAGRRLLALLVIVGLGLAVLVLPASAQTSVPPPASVAVSPSNDLSGNSGTWSIVVSGANWPASSQVQISFDDAFIATATANSSGSFQATITPTRRPAGRYQVAGFNNVCAPRASCPRSATTTFTAVPQLQLTPTCHVAGTTQLTVRGVAFARETSASISYGGTASTVVETDPSTGDFTHTFTGLTPSGDIVITASDRFQNAARATWSRCVPGATTTTSTSTTAPPDTVPDTVTTPAPTTTTARPRPGDPPTTTPPTLPPTIELPPPTPGATLSLSPKIGPPGFVTGVTGTGFPPGPVTLVWSPGIGTTTTIAGPDGTLSARVLIFPGDRLGPRALVATAGATSAFDAFLVVPSTVQPSGQNVAQINRNRRFNNR